MFLEGRVWVHWEKMGWRLFFDFRASWWWCWIVFVVWLFDERYLTLFPARTIVKDPYHREYPTHSDQDLSLHRNLSSDFIERRCAVVITTTPRRHHIYNSKVCVSNMNHIYDSNSTEIVQFNSFIHNIVKWPNIP